MKSLDSANRKATTTKRNEPDINGSGEGGAGERGARGKRRRFSERAM